MDFGDPVQIPTDGGKQATLAVFGDDITSKPSSQLWNWNGAVSRSQTLPRPLVVALTGSRRGRVWLRETSSKVLIVPQPQVMSQVIVPCCYY